jgi:hypothetical protein
MLRTRFVESLFTINDLFPGEAAGTVVGAFFLYQLQCFCGRQESTAETAATLVVQRLPVP